MSVTFRVVDGPGFAEQAACVLTEAWPPPCLHYTPAYLRWQLAFPPALPAAAAFDGEEAVGFAGLTARRVRRRGLLFDAAILSFVAVRPSWQGRGVASRLYDTLLGALGAHRLLLLRFASASAALPAGVASSFARGGHQVREFGVYPLYTGISRREARVPGWEALDADAASLLPRLAEALASNGNLLWSDPSPAQIAHYLKDPRPRRLIAVRHGHTGAEAAAWAVHAQMRTARGLEHVTVLETLFVDRSNADALAALLQRACELWDQDNSGPKVVTLPSLLGFDAASLKRAGVRQTGAPYVAQLCAREFPEAVVEASGTNLEVV